MTIQVEVKQLRLLMKISGRELISAFPTLLSAIFLMKSPILKLEVLPC